MSCRFDCSQRLLKSYYRFVTFALKHRDLNASFMREEESNYLPNAAVKRPFAVSILHNAVLNKCSFPCVFVSISVVSLVPVDSRRRLLA